MKSDPIELELFRHLLVSIAEEMGAVLRKTSYSANIKERRDYSCAVYDHRGETVAMGDHMPVHLGAMPLSVRHAMDAFRLAPGDVVIVNDPFRGGTHLPDITAVSAIYVPGSRKPGFYVANRAHHADVGGMSPGSMPLATEIYQEGIIIPPIKLWEAGQLNQVALDLILRNVRTPQERRGDLAAQIAANRTAIRRMQELIDRWSLSATEEHIDALIIYAERITRATLQAIPDGCYEFTDYLDNDGISDEPVAIAARVTVRGDTLTVDFTGSALQTRGNVNT